MRKQYGLSLVELLISITLGLILIAGVTQMLLGTKLTFNSQKALSRVQESGRLAIEFMSKDIRMAGYLGCASRSSLTGATFDSVVSSAAFQHEFLIGIRGYSSLNGAGIVSLANTDVLEISGATGKGVVVQSSSTDTTLVVDSTSSISVGDYLIVSDCVQARVFQATALTGTDISHETGNSPEAWGTAGNPEPVFGPGSEIIQMEKKIYYIKNNTAGEPSLWLWANGVDSEIIEGIEDMIITYGRDTNSDDVPDIYDDAPTVTAANGWSHVLSVRVELLVRTAETVLNEDQSIRFPLAATTATKFTDRRLRQVFTTTIGIRSRLQ